MGKSFKVNFQKNNHAFFQVTSFIKPKKLKPLHKIFHHKGLLETFDKINKSNGKVALVGGVVRSILLKEKIIEKNTFFDLATNLQPKQIIKIFKNKNIKYIDQGIKHGTVTLKIQGLHIELTSLRKDIVSKGRYADVDFLESWEVDAKRRDLTINAIYIDPLGNIYDPVGGIKDLFNGRVEFIGDIGERIKEDYLRMLRFIRFHVKYSSKEVSEEKILVLKKFSDQVKNLSKERILQEQRIIFSQNLSKSIISADLMIKTDLDLSCYGIKFDLAKIKALQEFSINLNWISKLAILTYRNQTGKFLKFFPLSSREKLVFFNLKKLLIKKEVNQLLSDDWKFAVYYLGDDVALRLLLSSDLTDKIKNRMKLILKFTKPEFPICGDDLIKLGFRQGVDLGKVLKKLEIKWVKSNFLIDKDQLLAETNN